MFLSYLNIDIRHWKKVKAEKEVKAAAVQCSPNINGLVFGHILLLYLV
jgi:hypothetical protein